jgi:hypothetical protein
MVGRATAPGGGPPPASLDATSFESLVESVFDLGEAVPLSSVHVSDDGAPTGHAEVATTDEPTAPAWWALLPESEVVARVVAWLPSLRPRGVLAGLRLVRPRYRVLGAGTLLVGAAALVLGTSVTGDVDRAGTVSPGSTAEAAPASGDEGPATEAPRSDASTAAGAAGQERPRTTGEAGEADQAVEATVLGGDAGAAATILLGARLGCLREATPDCLAAVDQAGSPLALRDAAVLADPSLAGELAFPVEVTGESSAAGGTVLLRARGPDGEPASVLVMRTEAGWRLRDVFVGG